MTEQEFAYLSDRIRGKLTSLARRFNRAAGLEEEAEDIVQDALVTLWQLAEKAIPSGMRKRWRSGSRRPAV
jgi:Sigma-70 region 2.